MVFFFDEKIVSWVLKYSKRCKTEKRRLYEVEKKLIKKQKIEIKTGGSLLSVEDTIIVVVEKEKEDLDFNFDLNDFTVVFMFKL